MQHSPLCPVPWQARILEERAESKREGELLRSRAQQEAEELRAKEAARMARAREFNAQTKEANRTLQEFRLEEKAREREQEAAIEAYSRKKAELQASRMQAPLEPHAGSGLRARPG